MFVMFSYALMGMIRDLSEYTDGWTDGRTNEKWRRNRGFRRFNQPGPRAPEAPSGGPQKNFRQDS